jgi:hypothetical protein
MNLLQVLEDDGSSACVACVRIVSATGADRKLIHEGRLHEDLFLPPR